MSTRSGGETRNGESGKRARHVCTRESCRHSLSFSLHGPWDGSGAAAQAHASAFRMDAEMLWRSSSPALLSALLASLAVAFVTPLITATAEKGLEEERYVPYVPTPEAVVDEMLEIANVSAKDIVYPRGTSILGGRCQERQDIGGDIGSKAPSGISGPRRVPPTRSAVWPRRWARPTIEPLPPQNGPCSARRPGKADAGLSPRLSADDRNSPSVTASPAAVFLPRSPGTQSSTSVEWLSVVGSVTL